MGVGGWVEVRSGMLVVRGPGFRVRASGSGFWEGFWKGLSERFRDGVWNGFGFRVYAMSKKLSVKLPIDFSAITVEGSSLRV